LDNPEHAAPFIADLRIILLKGKAEIENPSKGPVAMLNKEGLLILMRKTSSLRSNRSPVKQHHRNIQTEKLRAGKCLNHDFLD
jgi:hypothetical protein